VTGNLKVRRPGGPGHWRHRGGTARRFGSKLASVRGRGPALGVDFTPATQSVTEQFPVVSVSLPSRGPGHGSHHTSNGREELDRDRRQRARLATSFAICPHNGSRSSPCCCGNLHCHASCAWPRCASGGGRRLPDGAEGKGRDVRS